MQNAAGARFCNNCGSPLDLKAPTPPGATAPPYPSPYAPPQPRSQMCEPHQRNEEECMGQTRVPGLVIFALIILMIGVFALIQWLVDRTYSGVYSGVIWPIFGIVLAVVLIGVWLVARPRAR